MSRRLSCCAFGLVLILGLASSALASDFHSFDAGTEGWQVVSYPFRSHAATPSLQAAVFDGVFGNPAGSVRVGDVFAETGIAAPVDHLGNQGAMYGDTLRFDILVRFSDNLVYPAVVLNGGTKSVYYDMPSTVVGEWETRTIPLVEGGWNLSNAMTAATQADFMDVLANLAGIYIYTEWHTGDDDTSVDNIAFVAGTPTAVGSTPSGTRGLRVDPVFPNPGADVSLISFALARAGRVTVGVYDVKGRRVRTLVTDVFVSGAGSVAWDGRTDDGEATPSGIYFARVATDAGDVGMRKIVRLR